jgi:hypothetical protein
MMPVLVLAGCGGRRATDNVLDPVLASLVPTDTVRLIGVRMDRIRTAPLYQRYGARLRLGEAERILTEAGFDPRTDLDQIVAAYNGKAMLVAARGRFRRDALEKRLAEAGAKKSEDHGITIHTWSSRPEDQSLAWLDEKAIVMGPDTLVRSVLPRARGRQTLPPHLDRLLAPVPALSSMWGVTYGAWELNLPSGTNLSNATKILGALDTVSAWGELSSGLRVAAHGTAADEAAAKKLHTSIRGLIGLARLAAPDDQPDLLRVYDSVDVRQEAKVVRVTANWPGELVDQLVALVDRPSGTRP